MPEIPFAASSKTKEQVALNKQLLSFGCRPTFLGHAKDGDDVDTGEPGLVGRGRLSSLNDLVVGFMRTLKRRDNASVEDCNKPNDATAQLWRLCGTRFGISVDYNTFQTWGMRVHNTFALPGGAWVYGTDSYHSARRHDVVSLSAGGFGRLVATLGSPSRRWTCVRWCWSKSTSKCRLSTLQFSAIGVSGLSGTGAGGL